MNTEFDKKVPGGWTVTTKIEEFIKQERACYPALDQRSWERHVRDKTTYCPTCKIIYWAGCAKRCKCKE